MSGFFEAEQTRSVDNAICVRSMRRFGLFEVADSLDRKLMSLELANAGHACRLGSNTIIIVLRVPG